MILEGNTEGGISKNTTQKVPSSLGTRSEKKVAGTNRSSICNSRNSTGKETFRFKELCLQRTGKSYSFKKIFPLTSLLPIWHDIQGNHGRVKKSPRFLAWRFKKVVPKNWKIPDHVTEREELRKLTPPSCLQLGIHPNIILIIMAENGIKVVHPGPALTAYM